MEDDDLIRKAIRDYAYAAPSASQLEAVRRQAAARRRRQQLVRLATAAVVALVIGGVIAWIALIRPPAVAPIDPSPSPTAPPSPTSSPSPSAGGYAEQSRDSGDFPTGNLGDTVEGLTLIDVQITDAECPNSSRCPGIGSLTVENSTSAPISAYVYFNVWRNNNPAVANAELVELGPGESTTVLIDVQPALSDTVPAGSTGSLFSWNFSVELA